MKISVRKVLSTITTIILLLGSSAPLLAASEKPNILLIMVDNLGYGELGVYGGGELRGAPTPRIDELAAQSMRLTNFKC